MAPIFTIGSSSRLTTTPAKLSADILDKLDIFVLEIEELQIPQPLLWEYLWCLSILPSVLSLSAIKKNQITTMKRAIMGIIALGNGPLIFCFCYYISDCWRYLTGNYTVLEDNSGEDESDENAIQMWQGYPYGLLWFAFVLLATQVHMFFMYFANNLISAWKARGALRKQQ
ncbi:jagunal isoform X2 [Arctopsyche grandis]|uniref:jagunal isoform X2 n=1 Tax=Arctopsyche grandis TaxID=121162 RepID=UPI00406D6C3F